jgi:hypothetical protein
MHSNKCTKRYEEHMHLHEKVTIVYVVVAHGANEAGIAESVDEAVRRSVKKSLHRVEEEAGAAEWEKKPEPPSRRRSRQTISVLGTPCCGV